MNGSINFKLEIEKIETAMQSYEGAFAELGLVYVDSKVVESQLAGESLVSNFRSPTGGTFVQISVFPGLTQANRGFIAIITNQRGETLSVNQYLRIHHEEALSSIFTPNTRDVEIESFVRNCCDVLINVLKTELKGILDGTRWERVPVDWKGYR